MYFPVVQFVKDAVRVSSNTDFHLLTTRVRIKIKAFKQYFTVIRCIIFELHSNYVINLFSEIVYFNPKVGPFKGTSFVNGSPRRFFKKRKRESLMFLVLFLL